MSDGTLRALGVLVALFQNANTDTGTRHLVGIEEPESALHPAAAGVLRDSLEDATAYAQILVTAPTSSMTTPFQTIPSWPWPPNPEKRGSVDSTKLAGLPFATACSRRENCSEWISYDPTRASLWLQIS